MFFRGEETEWLSPVNTDRRDGQRGDRYQWIHAVKVSAGMVNQARGPRHHPQETKAQGSMIKRAMNSKEETYHLSSCQKNVPKDPESAPKEQHLNHLSLCHLQSQSCSNPMDSFAPKSCIHYAILCCYFLLCTIVST